MPDMQNTSTDISVEKNDLQTPSVAAEVAASAGQNDGQPSKDCTLEPTSEQDVASYEKITWPEDISIEPAKKQAFQTLAAELKLSSEQVQKLVDFETAAVRENTAKTAEEKRQTIAGWARQTKAYYGAKLDEEISFALRAADAFGGPDFRALLEDTGLGNHPIMIRTLVGIGRCISEDACPGGQPAAKQDKTFAEALYGKR